MSNAILVRHGRRELAQTRSQSFWSRVAIVHDSCPDQGVIRVMSSAAVAVVLGASELGWFGQHGEHLR